MTPSRFCSGCGYANNLQDRFCLKCGTQLLQLTREQPRQGTSLTKFQWGLIIAGGVLFGILVLAVGITDELKKSREKSNSNTSPETAAATPSASVAPLAPDATIKEKATSAAGSYLRSSEVNKYMADDRGGYIVLVHVNGMSGFTDDQTKSIIKHQVAEIYYALYSEDLNVREAVVFVYAPLTDQYGNTKDGLVYKTDLMGDVARKVNWKADRAVLLVDILPKLWKLQFANVSLRD